MSTQNELILLFHLSFILRRRWQRKWKKKKSKWNKLIHYFKTCCNTACYIKELLEISSLLNSKFHISQISHCEKLVPILHSAWKIGTKTSHISYQYFTFCEICARSEMICSMHAIKYPPNLLQFPFDSNSSHICQDFITWFKQVTDIFHMFYSWKIWDRSQTANQLYEPHREKMLLWSSCSRFASLCPCRYRNKHLSFNFRLRFFQSAQENFQST